MSTVLSSSTASQDKSQMCRKCSVKHVHSYSSFYRPGQAGAKDGRECWDGGTEAVLGRGRQERAVQEADQTHEAGGTSLGDRVILTPVPTSVTLATQICACKIAGAVPSRPIRLAGWHAKWCTRNKILLL